MSMQFFFLQWQSNRTCVQGDIMYFDFSKESGTVSHGQFLKENREAHI